MIDYKEVFKERVRVLAKELHTNVSNLEASTPLGRNCLRNSNPAFDKLVGLCEQYPNLSAEWLLRGNGPVFIKELHHSVTIYEPEEDTTYQTSCGEPEVYTHKQKEADRTQELIDSLRDQIAQLKVNIATKDAYINLLTQQINNQ